MAVWETPNRISLSRGGKGVALHPVCRQLQAGGKHSPTLENLPLVHALCVTVYVTP